jgi:hypothetical protein
MQRTPHPTRTQHFLFRAGYDRLELFVRKWRFAPNKVVAFFATVEEWWHPYLLKNWSGAFKTQTVFSYLPLNPAT